MEDREPYITGGKMRDKFLTEAMGEPYRADWDAFGRLWAFLIAQRLQEDFIEATWKDLKGGEFQPDWVDNQLGIRPDLIDPVKFADAVYKYLKNRG